MPDDNGFRVDDYVYDLPENLIAQIPTDRRDASRLLVMNRMQNTLDHGVFSDITKFLVSGDVLVLNNVRVIPARLFANRVSGGNVEILILDGHRRDSERTVLLKPARRIKEGEFLVLPGGLQVRVTGRNGKQFTLRMPVETDWEPCLDQHGRMPLPPYIKRSYGDAGIETMDKNRYQTVFAEHSGAVAAPTAGLHFTEDLLENLKQKGIRIVYLTLWVGWGTFKPVECRDITDHTMDSEIYSIPPETADEIMRAKRENSRIVAVGTTSTRALESWATSQFYPGSVEKKNAELFITPGYAFQIVNAMITNFHLPGSTLIMLVAAFAGRRNVLNAYHRAVEMNYRFYSYGDAMLVL